MKAPFQLTALEARRQIDAGTLTAETLARSCLERIAAREPLPRMLRVTKAGSSATKPPAMRARDENPRNWSRSCTTDCICRTCGIVRHI